MRLKGFIIGLGVLFMTQMAAGQYYFGRNKVQYNTFEWHILKTVHFDIHFYPQMREIAEIGAAFAEESYQHLEDKFNHNINRRIPLIFYSNQNHFQQTNVLPYLIPEGVGGFFEFIKGRVVVPFDGSVHNFKRVIRHELIHVFMHSKVERILKDHKILTYPELPLWYIEGLAEYWSEGWSSEGEIFIRDATLSGYLVPIEHIYQINGTYLMYKEGQYILKYLAETYGEEKVLQLIENIWKEDEFSKVMKLTIGLNYKEFDEQWIYHLKKTRYPLLQQNDFPRMVSIPITERGFNTKSVFYRAGDTRKVIYVSNRTGYSSIYMQDLVKAKKGNKVETLIEGERTPDFEAFHILRSKIDVNRQGMLAFISKSGAQDVIYLYNLQSRKIVRQLSFDNIVTIASPAWSPDNKQLVFSGSNFGGLNDLYIVDLETNELRKLTNDFYEDRDPAWSPDGQNIVFCSDRTVFGKDGFYNIFMLNLKLGRIHYLTCEQYNNYSPVWSPDGKYVTFTSDRNGVFNIWMLVLASPANALSNLGAGNQPADASVGTGHSTPTLEPAFTPACLKQLTNFTTGAYDPVWTDDGSLLFTALDNFSMQIMELTGVQQKFDQAPVVPPDSLVLASSAWEIEKLGGRMNVSSARYRNKFTLDVAQSQITQDPIFGTSGGAQLAMTDMLGNYQYFFLIFNNAQTRSEFLKSFNLAISRVDLSRRTNYALGAYHFSGNYYNYAEGFFYERRYGGFGAVSYPFSMFSRLEGSINIRQSDKEWYGWRERKALLFSNYLSYIKDNSLWGPSGPLDGERWNFTLGNTLDVKKANVNFYTLIGDYRKYFRTSLRTCYAVRLMLMYNHGKEALPFFMGGSWDLRGYRRWSIWGTKLGLISQEFRFPFIDYFLVNFPFGGIGFSSIRGAAFVDVGNAWDQQLDQILGSYGLGVRFRLGGFLVLRLDYGRKFHVDHLRPHPTSAFWKLQPGTFTQFFFGWDF
ncbi:hypothetical protein L0128_05660 [candidate division KSB1 bacterium]|nr:hypothetical protein [candidate division KSB1 bacterium]